MKPEPTIALRIRPTVPNQRGGEFGGVITADGFFLNGFSTNPDLGPPLMVLDIAFMSAPTQ